MRRILALAAAVALLVVPTALAAERATIEVKYTWNLADLYPDEAAWIAAKEKVAKRIAAFGANAGKLDDSAAALHQALVEWMDLDRETGRIGSYAMQLYDQDTRLSRPLQMRQEADQLRTDLRAATSFVRPEILAAGREKIDGFLAAEPKLAEFRPLLQDILRRAPHTLGASEEQIVAKTGNLADAGYSVYSIFANADMPYPEVVLSDGTKVRLDAAAYTKYRASGNRADRDKVFKTFWTRYAEFERTFGTTLYATVQSHVFNKDVRKFGSSLEASLFDANIPTKVYEQLVADVHANLPTLHRYLKLRQRIMGVDQLRYEDLYAPIVKSVDKTFTPEEAMALTLEAFKPLGKDYLAALEKGYRERWVDFLPNTGKRSGAYSNTVYGVHPFQLLNFVGGYEDVSTLAHESGHSMHSYLSTGKQPYVTSDYATFVAEVASTFNENLFFHHMLDKTQDDTMKLFLLGSYLDNLRTTLFRQTLFAEFELKIHQAVEKGEPLTGEGLTKLYRGLLKEYYGDAAGVCKVDDLYGIEWAYIPHFYYNFYVYQYATSVIASVSLAEGVIGADAVKSGKATGNRDAYLTMLASGSSKYPIELLKGAGVDMTTSAPFGAAMREMNRIMDAMETILSKSK